MSEYEDDFLLNSSSETFTEDSDESEDDVDNDNVDNDNVESNNITSNYEYFDPCADLNERNNSFLHEIFEDNDETSSSDSDSYESEVELDYESEDESEDESKDEQSNSDEFNEIIEISEQKELTACVVIDLINGQFQRCGQKEGSIRQLRNLYGMWQVDRNAVKEVNSNLSKLGVCDFHFQFDNKYLHKSREKGLKNFETGMIQWRKCISCNKLVTFFSREVGCTQHSWRLNERNIQVPCIGQYGCEALKVWRPLCVKTFDDIKNPVSICCSCYEKLGGHVYQRPGKGKKGITCTARQWHLNDTSKALEFLGNWLIDFSQTEDEETKEQILLALVDILTPFTSFPNKKNKKTFNDSIPNENINIDPISTSNTFIKNKFTQLPSLFIIKTLFINPFKKIRKEKDLKITDFEELGCVIGDKLWNS